MCQESSTNDKKNRKAQEVAENIKHSNICMCGGVGLVRPNLKLSHSPFHIYTRVPAVLPVHVKVQCVKFGLIDGFLSQ